MSLLENFSTKELVAELRNREGVQLIDIDPYDEYFISSINLNDDIEDVGPAIILIVTD